MKLLSFQASGWKVEASTTHSHPTVTFTFTFTPHSYFHQVHRLFVGSQLREDKMQM